MNNPFFIQESYDDFSLESQKRRFSKKKKSSGKKSQDYEKFLVTLSGGIGIPIGDFGKPMDAGAEASMVTPNGLFFHDKDDVQISIQTGFSFNASFTYRFIEYLGAEALIGGQFHSQPSFTSSASVENEFGYSKGYVTSGGASIKLWNFMAGAHGFLPISAGTKFTVEGRALIGLSSCITSEVETKSQTSMNLLDVINTSNNYDITTPSMSATAFSYLFGIGCRYNISDMFGISFFVDYFGTNPTFEVDLGDIYNDSGLGNFGNEFGNEFGGDVPDFTMPSVKAKVTQKITTLNFTLGFNVRF